MPKKITVGILFGGQSVEHEISVRSAKSIYEALDKEKFEPIVIGIDKQGQWFLETDIVKFMSSTIVTSTETQVTLVAHNNKSVFLPIAQNNLHALPVAHVDIIFPVIHGTTGEDGALQGLLKMMHMPYVGPNVLASALGMDKDFTKRILRDAGIPIAPYVSFHKHEQAFIDFEAIKTKLGLPLFVKPSNGGSSVGVSKVNNEAEFMDAVALAFSYDHKILCEECIKGRELECAILGNTHPQASVVGELILAQEFYSYHAKYIDENGAQLQIPAILSPELSTRIQETAIKVFQALGCEGLARIDFFMKEDNTLYVNEINTLPGFTSISMYPKLWQATGLSYRDLIEQLIHLSIERFTRGSELLTNI